METREIWTAEGIRKSFGASVALSGAHLSLRTGEIHALIGENGAGKSTLSKVAAGVYHADEGTFLFEGEQYSTESSSSARFKDIGLVFQEQSTSPQLSVAENVYLNTLRAFRVGPLLSRKKIEAAAAAQLDNVGADFDVTTGMNQLDFGQKKILEVARVLAQEPKIVFFDEVTAFLDARGRELVLEAMKKLKASGITVCFVTHHLDEIFEIADRVTVMRDGMTIQTLNVPETNRSELELLMVGREVADSMYPERPRKLVDNAVLAAENIQIGDRIRDASFEIHAGEIVGIAGLAGCGGSELLRAIAGDIPLEGGSLSVEGRPYRPASPRDGANVGVAYLPGERDLEGLLSMFSVRENVGLSILPGSLSRVSIAKEREVSEQFVQQLQIKTDSIEKNVDFLSGGNRQKVVLSKLLATSPTVLLLDNPTRGVDVGARAHIYQSIAEAAKKGAAVLVYSEELNELLGLCSRLLVLRKGQISNEFERVDGLEENDVISHML
jgi:ABC-type sugar transport system ATPase subunit